MAFLDSSLGACNELDGTVDQLNAFESYMAQRRGSIRANGIVDNEFTLSVDEHDGLYVALLDGATPVACCTMVVEEIIDEGEE